MANSIYILSNVSLFKQEESLYTIRNSGGECECEFIFYVEMSWIIIYYIQKIGSDWLPKCKCHEMNQPDMLLKRAEVK